jgi:hypothetical protein
MMCQGWLLGGSLESSKDTCEGRGRTWEGLHDKFWNQGPETTGKLLSCSKDDGAFIAYESAFIEDEGALIPYGGTHTGDEAPLISSGMRVPS